MKKILLIGILLQIILLNIHAQESLNTLLFTDLNSTDLSKKELEKVLTYFNKLIISGKIKSYNEVYSNDKNEDRPLTVKEFENIRDNYIYDTTWQTDPVSKMKVKEVIKYNYVISKVRFVTELVFDEKSKQMKTKISQVNFLAEVRSSEGIFVGYTTRYYVKL